MKRLSIKLRAAALAAVSLVSLSALPTQAATWHVSNFGGNFSRDFLPAAVWRGSRATNITVDLFAVNADGSVSVRLANVFAWLPWQPLGGIVTSNLAAVSFAPDRSFVFARGTDNRMYRLLVSGDTPLFWQGTDSPIMCGPPTAVSPAEGLINVFFRGCDGHLWHQWSSGGWGPWEDWGFVGGLFDPSAVSYKPANPPPGAAGLRYDIFYTAWDDNLFTADLSWDGIGWARIPIVTDISSALSGIAHDTGAAVFWRQPTAIGGTLGGMWHVNNKWGPARTSGWVTSDHDVHAVSRGTSTDPIYIFYRAANNSDIQYERWSSAGNFTGRVSTLPDADIGADPIPLRVGTSLMVFAVKQDGTLSVQSFW